MTLAQISAVTPTSITKIPPPTFSVIKLLFLLIKILPTYFLSCLIEASSLTDDPLSSSLYFELDDVEVCQIIFDVASSSIFFTVN